MTETFQLGDPVIIDSPVWPADPTSVSIFIVDSNGAEKQYVFGIDVELTSSGMGLYHLLIAPAEEGTYRWRWVATGAVEDVSEGQFNAVAQVSTNLDILVAPADFDSIRALLGVTVVDLHNRIIELPTYGPYMESRVKDIFPEYQLFSDEQTLRLRVALIYGVAATLAETYMKGGTVSLVHREEPRRNWSEWARILWNRYREALGRVLDPSATDLNDYVIDGTVITGPTRSKGDSPQWYDIYPPHWGSIVEHPGVLD